MNNLRFYFDNLWRWKIGMADIELKKLKSSPSLTSLKKTEWSDEMERLMRNRLVFGSIRYGLLHDPHKPVYDRLNSIIQRAKLYMTTGNDEYLVDVANLALLEFEEGKHPKKHFKSIDDDVHVKTKEKS
jgi:hypothetical protein